MISKDVETVKMLILETDETHPKTMRERGGFGEIIDMISLVCVPAWGIWAEYVAWSLWIVNVAIAVLCALSLPFLL